MSRQKDKTPGYAKILDAWVPPDDAGEPVGCVATSFTFSPVVFEEECLGRFLQLETDAKEDGPLYLVEREEKLAQLEYAAVLVDQHYARGVRSLRWHLLPARLPRGILHAKVSLLLWSRCARLIIASANLTESGYRLNHEVFGTLDYFEDSDSPLRTLTDVVEFLREAVRYADPTASTASPAIGRWNGFLDRVSAATRGWGLTEPPRTLARPRVFAVLTGPGRPTAFGALREQWPDSGPPDAAFVVSPFFDRPEVPNRPASELWALLKQRGEAIVEFDVTAEEVPGEKALLLHAPESLKQARPANRDSTETVFKWVRLEEGRPLHLKSIWLQNDRVVVLMMGSSNFTSAGLGLGHTQNLEANLAYAVGTGSGEPAAALLETWLPVEGFPDGVRLRWQPPPDEGEDAVATGLVPLPSEFGQANFGCDERQQSYLEFTFHGAPPAGWAVSGEDDRETFLTEAAWQVRGAPPEIRLPWPRDRAPSGFQVKWSASDGRAWWPVNVLSPDALPPPDELKNLSLEVLIDILTSATLIGGIRRGKRRRPRGEGPILDPLKRVDASTFLLQRTRRVSDALRGLRQRLERPVVSESGLNWRLRGPVGVTAFAGAIAKEAGSEEERCFLLAELCLEVARVKPRSAPGALRPAHVRAALREVAAEIRSKISLDALPSKLRAYVETAFEECSS